MKRPHKYGAERTTVGGITFDSKREAKRYAELRLLERAGEICDLQLQSTIYLDGRDGPILTPTGKVMRYIADFAYHDRRTNKNVLEDAKGYDTPESAIKRAICAAMGLEVTLV